ncbi:MAG: cytochrome c family protein [Candidatus Omnitrophota bacterium]
MPRVDRIICLVFAQQTDTAADRTLENQEALPTRTTDSTGQMIMPVEPGQATSSQTIVVAEPQAEPAGQMVVPVMLTPPAEQVEKPAVEEVIPYAGADTCKPCHPKQYENQNELNFSKSWKILKMRKEENKPQCIKCYAAGAGRPGGFISAERTPHLTDKQCEVCYGPGDRHVKNPAERQRLKSSVKEKNICLECHLCMTTHRTVRF